MNEFSGNLTPVAISSEDDDEEDSTSQQTVALIRPPTNNTPTMDTDNNATHNYGSTKIVRKLYALITLIGLLVIALTIAWLVRFRGGFAGTAHPTIEFNWHPLLMATSMVFLFGQACLTYRVGGRAATKPTLKLVHASINGASLIGAALGLKAVFDSHNLARPLPIPNLYTMHSWLGLTSVVLFGLQWLIGCTTFLYPGVKMALRRQLLPFHVALGTGVFLLAAMAAVTGLSEKAFFALRDSYADLPAEAVLVNCICALIALHTICVLYAVTTERFKRTVPPEELEILLDTQQQQQQQQQPQ